MPVTGPAWGNARSCTQVPTDQVSRELSALPAASVRPSGENVTTSTQFSKVVSGACPTVAAAVVASRHNFTVPFLLPTARREPSGEKATDWMVVFGGGASGSFPNKSG